MSKQILNEIDKLIADAKAGKSISPKVMSEVENISSDISRKRDGKRQKPLLDLVSKLDKFIDSGDKKQQEFVKAIVSAIVGIKIETPVNVEVPKVIVPEIKLPDINVEVPEIKIPEIKVPEVKVNIPEIKIPDVIVPEQKTPIVNIPSTMKVSKPTWLSSITTPINKQLMDVKKLIKDFKLPNKASKPISVRLTDGKKFYRALGGSTGGGGGETIFTNEDGDKKFPIVDENNVLQTSIRVNGNESVSVQNPLPTDGDSVYVKDLWIDECIVTNWVDLDSTGEDIVSIPFDNLHTAIENTTTDNPKIIRIHFNRTVSLDQVGLGCADHSGKNFSNVLIKVLGSGGVEREVLDDSNNNTKLTSKDYKFTAELCNAIEIEFHTTDTITLTNITIHKVIRTNANVRLEKPDGSFTFMQGTTKGNAKVSFQEYDEAFNTNPLPVQITAQDNFTIDAFGRMRTSHTDQRFDAEFIYDKQPFLFNEILTGTGTSTHNTASRDISLKNLSVVDGDGARMIQHWHNPYTPGNSQLVDITGTLNEANIAGGTASIFLLNNGVETEVLQSAWDNPVANVNWEFSQIFQFDFQSLKIGRIRFNMVRDGIPIQIHQITNDNIRAGGYWQYPAQPVKWEIYNTASETITEVAYSDGVNGIGFRYSVPINSTQIMRAVCTTVKSEGGGHLFDMAGFHFSADNDVTSVSVGTTLVPVLSIRSATTFNSLTNNSIVIPQGFDISTNNPIRYVILYRPTLTGASWVSAGAESGVEYDVSATASTGGTQIDSGYVSTNRNILSGTEGIMGKTIMSKGNNGIVDIVTICAVRTSTSNADTKVVLRWKEIR